jgi:formylmethanofuran dehydrogenase subunit B
MAVMHEEVVCPFCALACDDLAVESEGGALRVVRHGCPISEPLFALPPGDAAPMIGGQAVTLDAALARAAELLRATRLPLLGGLGTDVAGIRAAIALAERVGGVLDHRYAGGQMANVRAMQDGGWVTTTLAEIRNRADLVVFIGTDGAALAPRLGERCLAPGATLFADELRRRVVLVGVESALYPDAARIACPPERLAEAVGVLAALLDGGRLRGDVLAGTPVAVWRDLADELAAARYPVLVWAAGELPGRHGDLVVGAIARLLRSLNHKSRAVGLPLAGLDNIIGANQVMAWQTGVTLRCSLASGSPEQDPDRWSTATLLAGGAVDLLLWISSFRGEPPPVTGLPTIALARPGGSPLPAAEVVIPVGTPGLDHAGSVYRTDGVVALPVQGLRPERLPRVADVLGRLSSLLAS